MVLFDAHYLFERASSSKTEVVEEVGRNELDGGESDDPAGALSPGREGDPSVSCARLIQHSVHEDALLTKCVWTSNYGAVVHFCIFLV